jgi:N1-aminopropylagmatine ureohydrolase
MSDSIINLSDPSLADVVLIGVGYDTTSSFGKGARDGPSAIRACLDHQIELFDRVSGGTPAGRLGIAWVDVGDLNELDPERMVDRLERVYRAHAGRLRILVGGEHSVTNAALRAYADEASQITVVQVDAHADLREDDSDYNDTPHGRYAHCSVMRRALELGFRLCQVGIRAYSDEERMLFDDPHVDVWEWGPEAASTERIVESITTERVYLTLDADGLDPSVMPATGTPVPGGLDWYRTVELLRVLMGRHRLVGADIVEVAPRPTDQVTEYAAAQLVYSLIGLARPGG